MSRGRDHKTLYRIVADLEKALPDVASRGAYGRRSSVAWRDRRRLRCFPKTYLEIERAKATGREGAASTSWATNARDEKSLYSVPDIPACV